MKKEKTVAVLLMVCMTLGIVGCGSGSKDAMSDMALSQATDSNYSMEGGFDYGVAETAEMDEETAASISDSAAYAKRKLIKTVVMDVETKEFDSLMTSIQTQVKNLEGYIESMNTYNGSTYYGYRDTRNSDIIIRIPEERLDVFLNTISDICNVVRRSENVEDITLTYVDLESHRAVLEAEQTSLLELLERAETIEDIITIKSRLSDVRYQLESMEAQLRTFDNKVAYSTVYLNINEVEVLTPVQEETTWERISGGFVDSMKNIGSGLVEFMIWFVVHLPYLILWAIIITAIVLVIRVLIKREEKKRAKRAWERAQLQERLSQQYQQEQQPPTQTGQ